MTTPTGPLGAAARIAELLDPARLDRPPELTAAGYLDVLAPRNVQPRTLAQQAMHSGLLAAVYQRWWRPGLTAALGFGGPWLGEQRRDAVRALGLDGSPRLVLDVACGPGLFTRAFAEALGGDGLAVGLDVSPPMLARAVADNSPARAGYLRADARRLPFPDAGFAAVCCYAALYLVPSPFTVLAEMLRVLAPGGRVALLTSYRGSLEPVRSAQTVLGRAGGLRMFDRDEVTDVLRGAGLVDVRQRLAGFAQFVHARKPAPMA